MSVINLPITVKKQEFLYELDPEQRFGPRNTVSRYWTALVRRYIADELLRHEAPAGRFKTYFGDSVPTELSPLKFYEHPPGNPVHDRRDWVLDSIDRLDVLSLQEYAGNVRERLEQPGDQQARREAVRAYAGVQVGQAAVAYWEFVCEQKLPAPPTAYKHVN
ncbi:MAG TPA: hypothetical protein VK978_03965 [Candidatus Saccharimonadales bacterium]|nr:hypothetical protein [Candidatus Saccharimonadales bacterium]